MTSKLQEITALIKEKRNDLCYLSQRANKIKQEATKIHYEITRLENMKAKIWSSKSPIKETKTIRMEKVTD